jgi:hypothetical protein
MIITVYSNNSSVKKDYYDSPVKNIAGYAYKIINRNNNELEFFQEEEPEYFENNQIGYDYYYIPDHKYFVLSNTALEDGIFRAENISNNRIDMVISSTVTGSQSYIRSSGNSFRLISNNSSAFFYIATGGATPVDYFIVANNGNVTVNTTLHVISNLTVNASANIAGNLTVNASANIAGNLTVNNATVNNTLIVNGRTLNNTFFTNFSNLSSAYADGSLTRFGQNNKQDNSEYTLTSSDANKIVLANGVITIPNSQFVTGDHFYLVKGIDIESASLVPGPGVTLYYRDLVGNTYATNTNISLDNIGVLHVLCISANSSAEYFVAY